MTNYKMVLRAKSGRRGGFTLIEILIVVAIIMILVGLLLAIGVGAKNRAMRRSTLATLKILHGAMQDYLKTNPEPYLTSKTWPAVYTNSKNSAYDNLNISYTMPVSPYTVVPGSDITSWVARLMADQEASQKLASLPMGKDITTPITNANTVILDAWGTPICYVHSASFNSVTNTSTTYGYFLSAGPDGRFSMSINATTKWAQDEIYSTDPQ